MFHPIDSATTDSLKALRDADDDDGGHDAPCNAELWGRRSPATEQPDRFGVHSSQLFLRSSRLTPASRSMERSPTPKTSCCEPRSLPGPASARVLHQSGIALAVTHEYKRSTGSRIMIIVFWRSRNGEDVPRTASFQRTTATFPTPRSTSCTLQPSCSDPFCSDELQRRMPNGGNTRSNICTSVVRQSSAVSATRRSSSATQRGARAGRLRWRALR